MLYGRNKRVLERILRKSMRPRIPLIHAISDTFPSYEARPEKIRLKPREESGIMKQVYDLLK